VMALPDEGQALYPEAFYLEAFSLLGGFLFGAVVLATGNLHWNNGAGLFLQMGFQCYERLLGFQGFLVAVHQIVFQPEDGGAGFCYFPFANDKTCNHTNKNRQCNDDRVDDWIKSD